MARVEIDPGWQEHVMADWQEFADGRLGPDIAEDARRYCPVDSGALKESIENHMEGDDIIVSATGGRDGRTYAAYQELGASPHIIESHGDYPLRNRETGQVFGRIVHHPGNKPRPFLRPALFVERSE